MRKQVDAGEDRASRKKEEDSAQQPKEPSHNTPQRFLFLIERWSSFPNFLFLPAEADVQRTPEADNLFVVRAGDGQRGGTPGAWENDDMQGCTV